MKKRTLYTEDITETDHETNEVKKTKKTRICIEESEGNFVKHYDENIILDALPATHVDLARRLAKLMDYEGFIYLNKAIKDKICASMQIQDQTFRKYVSDLNKANVVARCGGGKYMINPEIYARGKQKEVIALREKYRELRYGA